jgi:putative ABC transport system permease protein
MPASYQALNQTQVAFASLLILLNGSISLALRLGLEKSLIWASIRTVVQLLLIGFVLEWVFQADRWFVVLGMLAVMTLIAGYTAAQRSKRKFTGIWLSSIISMWASSWLVLVYALFLVFQGGDEWYRPQYAIPVAGMILGNTLNGISIGMNSFLESLVKDRHHIETKLALGATRWEAARESVQNAVRTGMIPIINAMTIVGIVSLPGMMTGQLLSGTNPMEAVKYQIVIMFLIASATALGTVLIVMLSYWRLFSKEHQLLSHRIRS